MNFVEKLKTYFATTPRSKVLEDWEKTKDFDQIAPTVDEFLFNLNNITETLNNTNE